MCKCLKSKGCECACNVVMGFICSGIVLLNVSAPFVYFYFCYHNGFSVSDGVELMQEVGAAGVHQIVRTILGAPKIAISILGL